MWEEVGFVLVEAAISNLFIISSDCKNGPKEFYLMEKLDYYLIVNQNMSFQKV